MTKNLTWWDNRHIRLQPTMSFVLITHNLSSCAVKIVQHLRQFKDAEIIVVDDGSEHDHTKTLVDLLTGDSEFLIHSNDLFEILMSNRVGFFAHGKYIAFLQDDDLLADRRWVVDGIALLEKHEDMGVLGGRDAAEFYGASPTTKPRIRGNCTRFEFVQTVNTAPMWVRRSHFLELGGFDEAYAPWMYHSIEFCMRTWLVGRSVGWYDSGRASAIPTEKRRTTAGPLGGECRLRNCEILYQSFAGSFAEIDRRVAARNAVLR